MTQRTGYGFLPFLLLSLLLLIGATSGCVKEHFTCEERIEQEGGTGVALKALLRGAISVGTSTNDNRVKRLLVCLVPKTAGTITVVDVITNATNTPVWHDTTDPSKTYITVGTKGKKGTGWMDDYEIKLPHAGYYDILFIANPTDVVATKVKTAAYPAFLNDVLFSDTYPFTDADKVYSERVRMMSRVYYNQYIGQGTYEAPFFWQPILPSSTNAVFKPVSSFPRARSEDPGGRVGLLRAMAKLSLKLGKIDPSCLNNYQPTHVKVTLEEVPAFYTLVEKPWVRSLTPISVTIADEPWNGLTEVIPTDIYFPEKIFSATEPADWPDPLHDKGTLYLKIEIARKRSNNSIADPQVVKVPLFTATPEEMQEMQAGTRKYLDLVEEREADYNIYRNRHYRYTVNIPWEIDEARANIVFQSTTIQDIAYDVPIFN
ncbi:MAG: hypothetical protein QM237_04180 [Bacteroidota bacterium]|jgi:hypothetical protein|nr:hypothetical protein [Bacteroidota bacterium]HHU97238.1 hypothetical protein [Petrimonas sp.]